MNPSEHVYDEKVKLFLQETEHVSFDDKEYLWDFYENPGIDEVTVPLVDNGNLDLRVMRVGVNRIRSELKHTRRTDDLFGRCHDSVNVRPHTAWHVHHAQRGNGYGMLLRCARDLGQGTPVYDHAVKKDLALPLIAYGYMPVAFSTINFEADMKKQASQIDLLNNFRYSKNNQLDSPIWLEYKPNEAAKFLGSLKQ